MDEVTLRQIISEELRKIKEEELPEVLTLNQACEYLQVSDTWLKDNLEVGNIPYFRTGSHYKFNLSELREWTRSRDESKTTKTIIKPLKRRNSGIMRISL